jgi:hypothetical protein
MAKACRENTEDKDAGTVKIKMFGQMYRQIAVVHCHQVQPPDGFRLVPYLLPAASTAIGHK